MALITVRYGNDHRWNVKRGSTVFGALQEMPDRDFVLSDTVAALVNNQYASLWEPLYQDASLGVVAKRSPEGQRIQRRTLCYLCAMASHRLFRGRSLRLGHALGDAYYFSYDDGPLDREGLDALGQALADLVDSNLVIEPSVLPWADAKNYFDRVGRTDTAALLTQTNPAYVKLLTCEEWYDLDHGPLCGRSGQVPPWRLELHGDGFTLGHGGEQEPDSLQPFRRSPLLYSIYQEYHRWGEVLEVQSLAQLNTLARARHIQEFVWVSEALHQKKIADIAQAIADRGDRIRLVQIAGPSSSGKTTFLKRLTIQLRVMGFRPQALSLDDYFVDRDQTPRDEKGDYDFESIHALDLPCLNRQLEDLLGGREIELPSFDFRSGTRKPSGKHLRLPPRGIILMEGIHGLNPALSTAVPADQKGHIYVSALTQLNIDDINRIATTDNRLIRRMVRDHRYRGYSAEETLGRWASVRRGENRNIFPFQDEADWAFNSALDYELGVLKTYAEPLLRSVTPMSPLYPEARRLLEFLESFVPIPGDVVPEQSLLREFIGGSAFKY